MLNKKTCLMVLAVLFLFIAPVVYASPPVPPLPAAYYGNITVNGEPASVGTIIIAKIDGVEKGKIATNSSGRYGEDIYERLIIECGKNGDIACFYVKGVKAKESVTWKEGDGPKPIDLTFSNGDGGGDGGNGGPVPTTPTPTPTEKPPATKKIVKIISSIEAGKPESVTFEGLDIYKISIEVDKNVSNMNVIVEKVAKPEEITDTPGIVYSYYNITATNLTDVNVTATIEFKVNKLWIADENVDEAKIKLNRYGEEWKALLTSKINDDDSYVCFAAVSPGFSIFAISGTKKEEVATTPTLAPTITPPSAAPTPTPTPTSTPAPVLRLPPLFLILIVIAVIVIAGIIIILLRRK